MDKIPKKLDMGLKYAAKKVCAKSHEGCQNTSPRIRSAKNKKNILADFRCDINRKHVKPPDNVEKH